MSQDDDAKAEAYSGYYMNEAESDWCGWPSRWAICTRAFELSNTADGDAAQVAAETGWSEGNGGADAVRHCRWNALMTHEFGRETASGFAWRHEYDNAQPPEQQEMDIHNNLKGRDWAENVNSLQRCIDGVSSRKLIRLEN